MSGIILRGKDAAAHAAGFNSWPTLKTQGVTVVELSDDFTRTVLRMDVTDENANYMGTAFGGSLFSMLDPFLVVMTINQLGPDYVVWDKAAEIEFVAPGVGSVHATIEMPEETVAEMREAAAGGKKVLRWFEVPITADDGSVVANVRRQLYVRERRKDA
ncbi:acyl-coenzyme A thioesterase PaaI-like protein [Leucobacter komagatae]|uniref:Acyl-coenzyme A thioesterase PaaI-like protein n=1 Tax=Leucobacter komagatae TaxID=55969 RepID=A0A542Y489_9MICO|nr:DUF4442 domain-containing protein [Leucobacter komagatae]TQL42879.1 acyl-coenzyme A thioesterase PaaI-like protein [Leucobacter komagatae]